MTEAYDTRELIAALEHRDDDAKSTINDLSNDVLVSIFTAVGNLGWVRRTVPCVCEAWNELYCSEDGVFARSVSRENAGREGSAFRCAFGVEGNEKVRRKREERFFF